MSAMQAVNSSAPAAIATGPVSGSDSSSEEEVDHALAAEPLQLDVQLDEYDGDAQLSSAVVFHAVMEESLGNRSNRSSGKVSTGKKRKGDRCTPNIRALGISAFLFTLITVIQVFAANIAHSHALLMDCISMGVDAFTYMGNIVVECRKRDGGKHVPSQLIVVAASLGLLTYFTVGGMQESWNTVLVCRGKKESEGDEDDVNGWITLAFALGGVGFDLMCLIEFHKSNKKTGSAKQVNMFSAFLHVGADCLRSTSTLVMSLMILIGHMDSTCLDAYTSVLIGASIIAGAFVGFFKWMKMLITFFCRED